MPLKATVSKAEFDALPEAVRSEYTEKNGSYVLSVEGMVPKADLDAANTKLTEFRDNNRTLNEKATKADELAAQLKKYEGIDDPEAAKALLDEVKKKGGKGRADDIETLLKQHLDAAIKPLQTALEQERTARQAAQALADEGLLTQAITEVAKKAGARDAAIKHIIRDAKDVFVVKDGQIVAKDGKFSTERPAEPLQPTEWITSVKAADALLFEETSGAGARSGAPGAGGNPHARTLSNPDAMTIGQNLEDIASGKAVVAR